MVALLGAGCGSDEGSGGSPAPAANVSADIKDFEYEPREITVSTGAKVTWTNRDAANHTVTFKGEGAPQTIPNLRKGQEGSVTFDAPGTFAYICEYHPNMAGTVVVEE